MSSLTLTTTHTHTSSAPSPSSSPPSTSSSPASSHPFYAVKRRPRKPFLHRLLNRSLLLLSLFLDFLPYAFDLLLRALGPCLVLGLWLLFAFMHYLFFFHIAPAYSADLSSLRWVAVMAVGYTLYFLIMYHHVSAVFSDPGTLPPGPPTPHIAQLLEQERLTHVKGLTFTKHCRKCLREKPPRTHHCSVCRRCVLRFDHHCVVEGTLVALADGRSIPIERVQEGAEVLSYQAALSPGETEGLTVRKVDAVLDKGHRACVELLFSDARTLVCTPDHRIRTADGRWVQAGDLVVKTDEVAVSVDYPNDTAGAEGAGAHYSARVLPISHVRLVGRRDVGVKHVWDLSVPSVQGEDTRSFVANGVVVHNCPWIANCVGYRNYRHFYLFMLYLWWGCVYIVGLIVPTIIAPQPGHHSSISDTPLFLSLVVAFAGWAGLTGMLGLHTWLVVTNQTTLEFYVNGRRKEEKRKRGAGEYRNVYDLGVRRNIEGMLGKGRWLLSCLVPFAAQMPGNGLWFETRQLSDADFDDSV